ncbi:MAG: OsmC family protein [Rhodocyclaceae bacterium]|nr:OsmC family protein [Rhodocyclaceae bacterium]
MTQISAEIIWQRGEQDFLSNHYSRRHTMRFDGGAEILGSSSPHIVPLPMSDPTAVDPEEAFVASLSSCHMLWFLSIAAKRKFCVDSYHDAALGLMENNANGKMVVAVVTLRPAITFSGLHHPTRAEIHQLHHRAHEECFIANSVKSEIRIEPIYGTAM